MRRADFGDYDDDDNRRRDKLREQESGVLFAGMEGDMVQDDRKAESRWAREKKRMEADLRRKEAEISHLERRLKMSKENMRTVLSENESSQDTMKVEINELKQMLARKDGEILALQHKSTIAHPRHHDHHPGSHHEDSRNSDASDAARIMKELREAADQFSKGAVGSDADVKEILLKVLQDSAQNRKEIERLQEEKRELEAAVEEMRTVCIDKIVSRAVEDEERSSQKERQDAVASNESENEIRVQELRTRVKELNEEIHERDRQISEAMRRVEEEKARADKAGQKIVKKMTAQTEEHLRTIAAQARQINQIESNLRKAIEKYEEAKELQTSWSTSAELCTRDFEAQMARLEKTLDDSHKFSLELLATVDQLNAQNRQLENALMQERNDGKQADDVLEVLISQLADLESDLSCFRSCWSGDFPSSEGGDTQNLLPNFDELKTRQGIELFESLKIFSGTFELGGTLTRDGQYVSTLEDKLQKAYEKIHCLEEEVKELNEDCQKMHDSWQKECEERIKQVENLTAKNARQADTLSHLTSEIAILKASCACPPSPGSLNGSLAVPSSPGKPQTQYSKREEGNAIDVSHDADTTEEDLSEAWSVLSSTGGAQRSQDWEQTNPEQLQVNKLRQAIDMLQRRVRDQEAKANKFQTESQLERSRSVAQRADMQRQVMQQVDELSRQHKVVSDLTQALEQMHLELKASREREAELTTRVQQMEEEEKQIHRASKQSWTSEGCEFENSHLRAEVEDLRLCLQAAKDNTSLVREGMALKLLRVESKLRDKEIECFRLRELLGLSSSSSPDPLEGSESLRAKSTTDFHVNPAQVLREFLSSPRAPARSQREQEKEEGKSGGQDGERVKDLEEELQRKEEAARELVKSLKEEHDLVKRELQGRINELEEELKQKTVFVESPIRPKSSYPSAELNGEAGFSNDSSHGSKTFGSERALHAKEQEKMKHWLKIAEKKGPVADDSVDTEMVKKLVIQLLAETEELQSFVELHSDVIIADDGKLSDDEATSEQGKLLPSGAEDRSAELAELQQAISRKEQMVAWLRSKIMRFADLLKDLRDDSITSLRQKDKLIAELQLELTNAAEKGQDEHGHVELRQDVARKELCSQETQTGTVGVEEKQTGTGGEEEEDVRFSILKPDAVDKDATISQLNDEIKKLRELVLSQSDQISVLQDEVGLLSFVVKSSWHVKALAYLKKNASVVKSDVSSRLQVEEACSRQVDKLVQEIAAAGRELREVSVEVEMGLEHMRATSEEDEESLLQERRARDALEAELGVLRERVQRYEEERKDEREKAGGEEKREKRESYLSLSNMTMPVEEKTQMIIELKAKISQLYKELKEGEENMLLLTKKYDMMKRNMKTYKLDVAGKIGQLREQLQDKEEELRELEKKSGKTSHKN
ncbi:hypothetical protein GUITHDRAFT_111945 [Guillardia theta CCMP2712]|uniref:Uncharacterized protein n=1 Tax=Guillardia theta (strain CCMP2712) TaxID=905079 RepID=L1J0N6_GUITC|nr:hypothetical protein GUITHDRAFT_111945 [Guillardia theta CCMP2712]EKX42093.1 hypothetical protein GUITHDRAFT_111945 [Guillardia theta CCMP2712]|eukprot:XP_005829073.1 hypothetical protein GUITHDRAFT_111945 [Guillardia theta CCMP2712]